MMGGTIDTAISRTLSINTLRSIQTRGCISIPGQRSIKQQGWRLQETQSIVFKDKNLNTRYLIQESLKAHKPTYVCVILLHWIALYYDFVSWSTVDNGYKQLLLAIIKSSELSSAPFGLIYEKRDGYSY